MNLLLQTVATLLILPFGLLSLAAWRRMEGMRWSRPFAAWFPTGVCFAAVGAYSAAHALAAPYVQRMDPGSAAYGTAVRWLQAGNVGRECGVIMAALVMGAMLAVPAASVGRVARHGTAPILLAIVAGTVLTARYGDMELRPYITLLAVMYCIAVVVLLAVLLAGVARDGLDQLLWLALAAYAVKETFSVSLFTILAWWRVQVEPAAWVAFYWVNGLAMVVMVMLAFRRLQHARAGNAVPALFERLHAVRGGNPGRMLSDG
ncbi:MAG TPA: hypothetical protein VF665_06000 [Longimicrobium sp.]|jgi:hypothetical protein|uniref:hypothetical protein n=1 Tax=Longimicrobium sp. TaxID=2029185 RepID=UPI002EDB8B40